MAVLIMNIVYKIMFFFSISLVILAVIAVSVFGLKLGSDFRGGALMEIKFTDKNNTPEISKIQDWLKQENKIQELSISPAGDSSLIFRLGEIDEATHQKILAGLKLKFGSFEEKQFSSVGAIIGKELKRKSLIATALVLFLIFIYIAFVFRKMARTLSPFAMSLAAIIALAHDVLIPIGVFSLLGRYQGIEITAVFVAAILTILGFSVSDTVVVFDRIRENVLRFGLKENFGVLVHKSIMQTLTRSLNTTFATLLSLVAIYFFGGESIKYFSLAMIIGIFLGAYSSIFVASPILVWWSSQSRH